eukprot:g593.t1
MPNKGRIKDGFEGKYSEFLDVIK